MSHNRLTIQIDLFHFKRFEDAMHENELFDMFDRCFLLGTYPWSDTCYIVFCGTIIQCDVQIENLSPQHHGATTFQ